MECKITATLSNKEAEFFAEVKGENFYKVDAVLAGQEEPVKVIISEYLLPEKDNTRVELKFYLRTVREGSLSQVHPHVISYVEVPEDSPTVNEVVLYGYITNKGELSSTTRLSQNSLSLIVKYRVDGGAHFVRTRAHDASARRIYRDAQTSDDIHLEGILSIHSGRYTVDILNILDIKKSPTKVAAR